MPGDIEKVAILVNPSWEEGTAAAATPGITILQLHGTETPEFCQRLMEEGDPGSRKGAPVTGPDSLANVPEFFTRTLLLDSGGAGEFGGSGRTFPWEIARDFVQAHPDFRVILAGGLTPENVAKAVAIRAAIWRGCD